MVFISRNLSEYGISQYAATNGPGYKLLQWLLKNKYPIEAEQGGNPLNSTGPKGVVILRRNNDEKTAPVRAGAEAGMKTGGRI